jgi:hypothetical protein
MFSEKMVSAFSREGIRARTEAVKNALLRLNFRMEALNDGWLASAAVALVRERREAEWRFFRIELMEFGRVRVSWLRLTEAQLF